MTSAGRGSLLYFTRLYTIFHRAAACHRKRCSCTRGRGYCCRRASLSCPCSPLLSIRIRPIGFPDPLVRTSLSLQCPRHARHDCQIPSTQSSCSRHPSQISSIRGWHCLRHRGNEFNCMIDLFCIHDIHDTSPFHLACDSRHILVRRIFGNPIANEVLQVFQMFVRWGNDLFS